MVGEGGGKGKEVNWRIYSAKKKKKKEIHIPVNGHDRKRQMDTRPCGIEKGGK
jgi:hypothetical protein